MVPPDEFDPVIGRPQDLEPALRRIVAPNPSPMTYRGTNTYLLGTKNITVVDPGPADMSHLHAILDAITPAQRVARIIVTHTHLDHSPLAAELSRHANAPVLAFGTAEHGRSAAMQRLAAAGILCGGEGVDADFAPDAVVADGEILDVDGIPLQIIHTPGHIGNHICLGWNGACLTADHVMGWASSLVSPPDGDLTDFMSSCAKLRSHDWRRFYPGHGDIIAEPAARLDWLVAHRRCREADILEVLQSGPADAATLARTIYTDTPPALLGAAARNVLAHLIDLLEKKEVALEGDLHPKATFRRR